MTRDEWQETLRKLAQPFDTLEFRAGATSGGKAMALAYIQARDVMRRLDEVVGPDWSFDYELLSADGKMVKGRLTVCGVTRCDAGESEKEDEPLKSAVSDSLKRAAVLFGIGRYLYYLPQGWFSYDPQKRRFTEEPRIDPAVVRRAVNIALGSVAPVQTPAARSSAPESRGDAGAQRAQQALERSEKPLPIAGGAIPDEGVQALRAECKALHIRLTGLDDQEGRNLEYRELLGLQPKDPLSPAEWETLRDLLTERLTNAAGVP